MDPACEFYMRNKKNQDDSISYSESVKIQSVKFPNLVITGETSVDEESEGEVKLNQK